MEITVRELSKIVNGDVDGDNDLIVNGFSPIEEAREGSLSFISNPKYNSYLYKTKAAAVLVKKDFIPEKNKYPTLIKVSDVYSTLSILLERFNHKNLEKKGIEPTAFISETATIGKEVYVGAFAYIGENVRIGDNVKIFPQSYIGENCTIGDNTIIYPGVKIYHNCIVGENCILHAGCVVGGDGFGFAPQMNGSYKKMPQTGNVVIERNVEIGANTTIDRATIQSTVIREGVKLDNLIQIAHNVEIGRNTVIAAQSGISGSTKIGENCVIGGQVGIVGHVTIADKTQIGAQSGISNSIIDIGKKWFGSPAMPHKEAMKAEVIKKNLPSLYKRIEELEKFVKDLKSGLEKK